MHKPHACAQARNKLFGWTTVCKDHWLKTWTHTQRIFFLLGRIGDATCTVHRDCEDAVMHSHCVSGTCRCHPGYRSVNQSTACLLRQVDDSCSLDADCSYAVPESHCDVNSTKCVCNSGRHTIDDDLSRCSLRRINDSCVLDSDCRDAVPDSFCDVTTCNCTSGYYVTSFCTKCTRRRILDECHVNPDCFNAVTNSYCHLEHDVVIASGEPMNVSESGAVTSGSGHRFMNSSFDESAGIITDENLTYVTDNQTDHNNSFDLTNLSSGRNPQNEIASLQKSPEDIITTKRIPTVDGQSEIMDSQNDSGVENITSQNITNDLKFPYENGTASNWTFNTFSHRGVSQESTVPAGYCFCLSGFRTAKNRTACIKRVVGDPCDSTSDCCDAVPNTTCSGDVFLENLTKSCVCNFGLKPIENGSQCVPRLIGEPCRTSLDCSTVGNSSCGNASELCECFEAFYPNEENTMCTLRVIGDHCVRNTQCSSAVENSECRSDVCSDELPCPHTEDCRDKSCSSTGLVCSCLVGYQSHHNGTTCERSKLRINYCKFSESACLESWLEV